MEFMKTCLTNIFYVYAFKKSGREIDIPEKLNEGLIEGLFEGLFEIDEMSFPNRTILLTKQAALADIDVKIKKSQEEMIKLLSNANMGFYIKGIMEYLSMLIEISVSYLYGVDDDCIDAPEKQFLKCFSKGMLSTIVEKEKRGCDVLCQMVISYAPVPKVAGSKNIGNKEIKQFLFLLQYAKNLGVLYGLKRLINKFDENESISYRNNDYDFSNCDNLKIEEYNRDMLAGNYSNEESREKSQYYENFAQKEGYGLNEIRELARQASETQVFSEDEVYKILSDIGMSHLSRKKFLEAFVLKRNPNGIESDLFDKKNRLRVRPIVEIKGCYFINGLILLSSIPYFKERVLHGDGKDLPRFDISDVHEEPLKELSLVAHNKRYIHGRNLNLDNIPSINAEMINTKKVKREIDFYYVKDSTLYLVEMKDLSENINFTFYVKTIDKLKEEQKKMRKMLGIIERNKKEFLKYIEVPGDVSIKMQIVLNNYSTIIHSEKNQDIEVLVMETLLASMNC